MRAAPADARGARASRTPAADAHRFGSHLSIAGGVHNAIQSALDLGFRTVQVFVKNQRQWRAGPLRPDDLERWHALRAAHPGFGPPIAHATYLINLASANPALFSQSRDAFAEELLRCDQLEIPGLVVHPGAAGDAPLRDALARVARALNEIFARYPSLRARPLLEVTAGQGSCLGCTFDQLAEIIAQVREPQRIGVCVDTCHAFAAGYDIRDPQGYAAMIALAERTIGLERIACWHLNDSKTPLGSRVDRHEHIGRGHIGNAGFRNLLADPRFYGLPMILETPKESAPTGRPWDVENLRRLRRLARPAR